MRGLLFSLGIVYLLFLNAAPSDFPVNRMIEIPSGIALSEIAELLEYKSVIKSKTLFTLTTTLVGNHSNLKAGRYIFEEKLPSWSILKRLSDGNYGIKPRKVVIPEGLSNKQISQLMNLDFNIENQGYLFPDTYYFDEYMTSDDIENIMIDNFNKKVGPISKEDLILASIVEEEASTTDDRKLIAGLLSKRLELGMPLQVDVALETYDNIGLPARPIVNPGLNSIEAVRNYKESPYLYYLSDKNGIVHYAKSFEEHKANRQKYGI